MSEAKEENHYGKDCPKGMVQIEFIGVDPKLRHSNYGYKPCERAFLEVWIDGKRFRIDVGDFTSAQGHKRRGLHIVTDGLDLHAEKSAVNSADIYFSEELPGTATHTAIGDLDNLGKMGG